MGGAARGVAVYVVVWCGIVMVVVVVGGRVVVVDGVQLFVVQFFVESHDAWVRRVLKNRGCIEPWAGQCYRGPVRSHAAGGPG